MQTPPLRALLAAILTILAALVVTITIVDEDGPDGPAAAKTTITVRLAPSARAAVPDRELEVPKAAVAAVAASSADDHDGSKSETPPGVKPETLEAGREQQDELAAQDNLPVTPRPPPRPRRPGAAHGSSPATRAAAGSPPACSSLHYTVSPNSPGWTDVDGITGYFARASTNASSNYVVDNEGHCNYIVRESDKGLDAGRAQPGEHLGRADQHRPRAHLRRHQRTRADRPDRS